MSKLLVILVFVLIIVGAVYFEKRRGDDMATLAGRLGLAFEPGQHRLPVELEQGGFDLFTQGPPNIRNRMSGFREGREVALFDFHYDASVSAEGSRDHIVADDHNSIERRSQGVIWFRSEHPLPDFDLSPGDSHQRTVGSRFGLTQVTFDGREEFNRRYRLLARDTARVRALFTDRVVDYLLEHPGVVLESRGTDVLFYRFEKLPEPRAIPGFLEEAERLLELIQR